jgi:hypothetical protein
MSAELFIAHRSISMYGSAAPPAGAALIKKLMTRALRSATFCATVNVCPRTLEYSVRFVLSEQFLDVFSTSSPHLFTVAHVMAM